MDGQGWDGGLDRAARVARACVCLCVAVCGREHEECVGVSEEECRVRVTAREQRRFIVLCSAVVEPWESYACIPGSPMQCGTGLSSGARHPPDAMHEPDIGQTPCTRQDVDSGSGSRRARDCGRRGARRSGLVQSLARSKILRCGWL